MSENSTQQATRTVERTRDGKVITINASDFDSSRHKEPGQKSSRRKPLRSAPRDLGTPAEADKIG